MFTAKVFFFFTNLWKIWCPALCGEEAAVWVLVTMTTTRLIFSMVEILGPRVHPWTLHKGITHTRGFLWKKALDNSAADVKRVCTRLNFVVPEVRRVFQISCSQHLSGQNTSSPTKSFTVDSGFGSHLGWPWRTSLCSSTWIILFFFLFKKELIILCWFFFSITETLVS